MSKPFNKMNKEELIKATESLNLMDAVKAIAKDPEVIINAEYVTVLEEFKAKQDELNSETKTEIEKIENKPIEMSEQGKGRVMNKFERSKLKEVKFKYIVTDHQSTVVIDDDEEGRTFPIQYGNLLKGPKNWNVGLHGNSQALPFSVAKKLEEINMVVHVKNSKGEPVAKSQPRFRVTKIDGWSQDEIDSLKRSQNTRKFKD